MMRYIVFFIWQVKLFNSINFFVSIFRTHTIHIKNTHNFLKKSYFARPGVPFTTFLSQILFQSAHEGQNCLIIVRLFCCICSGLCKTHVLLCLLLWWLIFVLLTLLTLHNGLNMEKKWARINRLLPQKKSFVDPEFRFPSRQKCWFWLLMQTVG